MNLLIATRNQGKAAEFADLFRDVPGHVGIGVRDLNDVADDEFEPEETGRTFRDNACLKASAYALRYNSFALADDSGLSVDVLGGAPGVHSARFAQLNGAGGTDKATRDRDNNAYLLRRLKTTPEDRRTARFECVLALSDPAGRVVLTTYGYVEGHILTAPRGSGGFGYDPLFLHASGRTTAEMSPEEKHAVSHRGAAVRRMRDLIARHGFPQASTA